MQRIARRLLSAFSSLFFDPTATLRKWRALPYFIGNVREYRRLQRKADNPNFSLSWPNIYFMTQDRFQQASSAGRDYFFQDLWAAKHIYRSGIREHVDVGSRIDGFVAHILPFCQVTYVDLRPLSACVDRLDVRRGSVLEMPFTDSSVPSLSCLHVIEHVGLGRYGDPVNPAGYKLAAIELTRVLAVGGSLLLGAPVGKERLCFDAHRIFDPETLVAVFSGLDLQEFSLIDDQGRTITVNASFREAQLCKYGCGLFRFVKSIR
jgi:hypothetical protein